MWPNLLRGAGHIGVVQQRRIRVRTYEAVDAGLIRTTTIPADVQLPQWPNLTGDNVADWRDWLRQVWGISGFASAIRLASAELAAEVERQLAAPPLAGDCVQPVRRLVETVARYLLRWQHRATPFGLFAGVAPLKFGSRAMARCGGGHQRVLRPDGVFMDEQVQRIEQRLDILRTVEVVTNNLGFARGRAWVVPGAGTEDHLWDVEVDLTRPVQLAVDAARQPILFNDLTRKLACEAPSVDPAVIERMLAELVARHVLLSAVRPPMTATDPAAHLASYVDVLDFPGRSVVDVRVDCSVTVPPAVVREAEQAASVLALVAPEMPQWQSYHQAFVERYGTGTAVPVRELVSGSGLGYPAGYRGSRLRLAPRCTSRDTVLVKIAQQAALEGCREVVLDDELIAGLTTGQRTPVPHAELRFSLAAPTLADVQRGRFTLWVISGARHAGVTVGRFLHLLDDTERERFRRAYAALPTAMPDAVPVQISGPPLARKMTAVARVPEILPILPLGEYQENPALDLDDLAVTGDARRLWLVSMSQGRPIEPMLLNAVDLPGGQQPLARFLTEIPTAFSAPCGPFRWGHFARELPFLPRIRHGRSILHSARWAVAAPELPPPTVPFHTWRAAWERLRETYRIPSEVFLGADDMRIRLAMDEPAHLAVLRSHLSRHQEVILTETFGSAGWIEGRAHEVVLALVGKPLPSKREHPRPAKATRPIEHRPGLSPWLYVKLYGRADDILAQAAALDTIAGDGWWFIRYHEPEPHLRLRIPLRDASQFGPVAGQLGMWADRLGADGLLHDYTINTYRPETRFGTGQTLAAAEEVFAADSHAVIQRLSVDRTIATAAGLITLADGFTGNGPRWLIEHVDHRAGSAGAARPVSDYREHVMHAMRSDNRLRQALADYRTRAGGDRLDVDQVLTDLLHLHHARMIGVDLASEQYCLRLARATAHTLLTRGGS